MTFLQLQQRLARRRGANDSSIPTATATRYKEELNEVHRSILRRPGMATLRRAVETFSTVANQAVYALPVAGIARVDRIYDTTNRLKLSYQTQEWLRSNDVAPVTGLSWAWVPIGYRDVHTQPSDASSVYAKSTSAGDTTQTIYLEGLITGGYYRTASVTLTGTTAVNLTSAVSTWEVLTKVYLSATAVGTVTLHEDSGVGTELTRITIGKTRAQFSAFQLYPTPADARTLTCDVTFGIPDMANDTDEPLLPEDFHDLLVTGAELRELTKQDDPQRWGMVKGQYDEGLKQLQTWVVNHPDYEPLFGREDAGGFSSLGAYFPADA